VTRRATLLVFLALVPVSGYAARSSTYSRINSCLAQADKAWNYRARQCEAAPAGPVDWIFIDKSRHWMAVYRGGQIVREFRVALGRGGLGPKRRQGDGRVPEGLYQISDHNPDSAYHLALRISYPTPQQVDQAAKLRINPGGDIMIHGLPDDRGWIGSRHTKVDWTEGCIALTNREIEWLYDAVPDGTPVDIRA
jgi:murein L,D-transpeptidase YafK